MKSCFNKWLMTSAQRAFPYGRCVYRLYATYPSPIPWAFALLAGRDWISSPKGIIDYWWVFVPISIAPILFGIGWNLLGDGLIDAMNPRSVEN